MKKRLAKVRRFGRRYAVVISIVLFGTLATVGALTWYVTVTSQQIQRTDAQTKQHTIESAAIAKATDEKKKAKAAEEEKARQEAAAQEAAEAAKKGNAVDSKLCNNATTHNVPSSIDVLVNKKHCVQPLSYVPPDLVTSNGATLSAKAIDAYNRLYAAAAAAGQSFSVTSSYRSYNTQISTYNRWISISGQAGADTYSARPGYSEHQTGFAFDVAAGNCKLDCFGSTSQYAWLQANAADYGFIQRYYVGYDAITGYKAEEWHYRYVGAAIAQDMKAKSIKTLEEYWNLPGGDY